MKKNEFAERLETTSKYKNQYIKKDNLLSKWRLGCFLLFGIFLVITIFLKKGKIIFGIVSAIFFIIFWLLVCIHQKVWQKLNQYILKEDVIKEYLARFTDEWHYFASDGSEYANEDNQNILSDLDIIGPESLYKFLCIAKTKEGKNKLIRRLSNQEISKEELTIRQKAIGDIINNVEFSIDYQVALHQYANAYEKGSISYVKKEVQKKFQCKKVFLFINIILTIMTYLSLILLAFNLSTGITIFLSLLFCNFLYGKIYAKLHKPLTILMNELGIIYILYLPMIKSIQNAKFNDENLFKFQYRLLEFDRKKDRLIKKFANFKIYQNNLLASLLVNGLFPFNTIMINSFNRFIGENKDLLSSTPDIISDFEELISLAIIGQVKEKVAMPIYTSKVMIKFNNLFHPLISEEKAVANSYQTNAETTIITGSNMSGKTTFMRTIGINLILMQAGTMVNGDYFETTYLKIITSMRITDDISKGISSFYRELLKIKVAIDYAKTKKPMIALIDEVFRGTNSNDRITGAIAMIKFLQMKNVILMITTHDQQLCEIEGLNLRNYYFSEYYENDQIKFDYIIKEGISPTSNAVYLMKLAGIIGK